MKDELLCSQAAHGAPKSLPLPWIIGTVMTPAGEIHVVYTKLQMADTIGSWAARWGILRMHYRVEPRLYAVGSPDDKSPVFVSANYKMSFDRLRSQLGGVDGWILVLDTKGINVWCAAGKGTFGTDEIVRRVEMVGLKKIVAHRRLIIPQLGATGVSAHVVRERSGFRVDYGPVRAEDIGAYLQAGLRATPAMRRITFIFAERLVLIPAEIVGSVKYAVFASACFVLLSGLGAGIYSLDRVAAHGITNAILPLIATLLGIVLPAIFLPWLPGRAFSVKGAWAAVVPMIGLTLLAWLYPGIFRNWSSAAGWFFLFPATMSFIGMNFTGSSTYTSLSGVKREMKIAVPIQIVGAVLGMGLWITGLFL